MIRMCPNELLRRERQRRGWSRQYVAEQIGVADPKTVGRWERGAAFPSSYFLQKLCTLFGMLAQDLGLFLEEAFDNTSETAAGQRAAQRNTPFSHHIAPLVDPAVPPPLVETDGLVGRDYIFQQLKQYLCAGKRPVMSAFSGLPGVGKTALARELVYDNDIQQQFADGILWVSLGLQPHVAGLLGRWGSLLGIPASELALLHGEEERAMALREAIGMRHMLLVIDDAWKSEDALAFKVGGPNCAYLLTTRIPPLALNFANGGAIVVRELGEADSLKLLARFVPDLFTSEPAAALALVQSTGGLPLALALIGRYLQSEAYCGQPRRLRAALERLRCAEARLQLSEQQTPIERLTQPSMPALLSLQAVIETSVLQLNEAAQQVLSQLSVFPARPHSFSEEAALAVSDAPVELLDELIDAGLLESAGPGRYTLHQTIADYASSKQDNSAAYQRMF
jgi:transcriptional regulator with XRE-family HTH domain